MKVLRPFISAFLFASNPNNNERHLNTLSIAREICTEAQDMLDAGKEKEAVALYEDALSFGRTSALALYEDGNSTKEGIEALNWLISLYCSAARLRIQLGDLDAARKDAWGACMFSQNMDIPSQECMAEVCKASGDDIGYVQALKKIVELQKNQNEPESDMTFKQIEEIKNTIIALEKKLLGK